MLTLITYVLTLAIGLAAASAIYLTLIKVQLI